MSHRQMFIGVAGVLLGVIGLMALWFPVYLDLYDAYGVKVTCGRGWRSDLTQALHASGTDNGEALVTRCDTAILLRRAWAIPAVILGWLLVTGFLVIWVHKDQHQDQLSWK
ncbi:hypothetical protein [Mycobacterium decipiens]|uniref:Transmembrane protein n=1 Tax=Mycobacterium decipiens TaxID=1430326 RepID=A0A1X2LZN8_9MYCO|nr:hypothetical protein [Mycobacterium decipiens]OSC42683.1 hypothetical protein B8W66_03870 [Mycobacterium decipiens]